MSWSVIQVKTTFIPGNIKNVYCLYFGKWWLVKHRPDQWSDRYLKMRQHDFFMPNVGQCGCDTHYFPNKTTLSFPPLEWGYVTGNQQMSQKIIEFGKTGPDNPHPSQNNIHLKLWAPWFYAMRPHHIWNTSLAAPGAFPQQLQCRTKIATRAPQMADKIWKEVQPRLLDPPINFWFHHSFYDNL